MIVTPAAGLPPDRGSAPELSRAYTPHNTKFRLSEHMRQTRHHYQQDLQVEASTFKGPCRDVVRN